MRKLIYLSTLLLLFVLPMMAQHPLFPTPAKVQNGKGSFVIGKNLQVQGNGGYADKLAAALPAELKEAGLQSSPASGTIRLELTNDCKMADEAYTLVVEPNSILLQASSEAGLFYAKEALLQLSRFGKGNVRACKIQDQPRYGWRGFMLDESRHFFGKEKVKQYLDIMASLRLNVFHWHLTDEPGWRIEIKRYPKLTTEGAVGNWHDPKAPATFYTQEEIKEIVASGELGEIRRSNWIINTWWRPDSYYQQSEWRATWGGEGGGVLVNQAPHQLDLWQWICGIPTKVTSKNINGSHRKIDVENDVTIVTEYANGATGSFITCTHDAIGTDRLEIDLDGGKIVEEAAPADFFDHPKTERAQRFLRTFTFDAVK